MRCFFKSLVFTFLDVQNRGRIDYEIQSGCGKYIIFEGGLSYGLY